MKTYQRVKKITLVPAPATCVISVVVFVIKQDQMILFRFVLNCTKLGQEKLKHIELTSKILIALFSMNQD
jgi:hypothetical protein